MNGDLKVFPVAFTEPTDERIVVVDQTHHEMRAASVKQSTIRLTVSQDAENVVVPIIATNGRNTADARLTLSIDETRKLIGYLEKAIADAEEFVQYVEAQEKLEAAGN